VRQWTEGSVSDEEIEELIDAARWAPSSGNKQALKFLVVRDEKKRSFLAKVVTGGIGFSDKAPVHILVLVDVRGYSLPYFRHMPYLDAGAAIQNILLMAHSIGLGACWLNWEGSISRTNEERVYEMFKIPRYYLVMSLVLIGHRRANPDGPPRQSLKEFLLFDSF